MKNELLHSGEADEIVEVSADGEEEIVIGNQVDGSGLVPGAEDTKLLLRSERFKNALKKRVRKIL